jgi:hypothetical protein
MRPSILLVCALLACAPVSREEWLSRVSARSEGLCWWQNARWEDRGTLLVRGTGEPFARARARWAADSWRGSSTSAVLRRAGPLVVLQGDWTGPGLTLHADVDVSAQAVFRAYEPVRLGAAGLLLKGGHVRVTDALSGRVLVLPTEDSLRPFRAEETVATELSCDALSLYAPLESPGDLARRQLGALGFAADSPERWVPEHASLPASATAGGATVGRFVADAVPLRGFVVEEKNDEARLVVPTRGGLVWVGWVPSQGLESPEGPSPEPVTPPERPPEPRDGQEWRSCDDRELPVSVEIRGKVVEVGTLKATTPFSVIARRGDYREVQLAVDWLELEPHVALLLPDRANECPRMKPVGAW